MQRINAFTKSQGFSCESILTTLLYVSDDMEFMKVAINNGKAYLVDSFKIRRESSPVTKIEKHPADVS